MGFWCNVYHNDPVRIGGVKADFKVVFTDAFKSLGYTFSIRLRKHVIDQSWQPQFLIITETGIDWTYSWNSENMFNYDGVSWGNVIEVEGGCDACQFQFEYSDSSKSAIIDIGKFSEKDVEFTLVNKKVKKLIIHPPSARQKERYLYDPDKAIDYNELSIGKKYCLVKRHKKCWDASGSHIISKEPVKIIDITPSGHIRTEHDRRSIEFAGPTVYIDYTVDYQVDNDQFYKSTPGYDYDYKHGYDHYFIDLYDSGKITKSQASKLKSLESEVKKEISEKAMNGWNWRIRFLRENAKTKKLKTVNIGGIKWVESPITVDSETVLTLKDQFADIIPKGYRIPTQKDWESLKSHEKLEGKDCIIYKDIKSGKKLKLPLMGTCGTNGILYRPGKIGLFWTSLDEFKIGKTHWNIMTHNNNMWFGETCILPRFRAVLMLIKE